MSKTILELAREATPGPWQAIGTLNEDNPHVIKAQPHSALRGFTKTICSCIRSPMDAAFIAAANPQRIIELCEALEGLIQKLDAVHADPKYMTVWQIAQLHQGPYDGPKYTDELARARRALKGD